MRQSIRIPASLAAVVATVLLALPSEAPAKKDNPLASLVRLRESDVFNSRLTDEEKKNPKPVRGGELVRRMPVDFPDLNPITATDAESSYLRTYVLEDPIARFDPEYYEFVPWVSDWWTIHDIIYLEDGTALEGLVTELEGTINEPTKVTLAKGAFELTVGRIDIAELDEAAGTVTLKDGRSFEGEITPYHHIIKIETTGEPMEVNVDTIARIDYEEDGIQKTRKRMNQECIFKFHLRENPRPTWHDGRPIQVKDIVLTFNTVNNTWVDGAHLRNYFKDVRRVEDVGGNTVLFEYAKPHFRALRTIAAMPMLPSHIINYESYQGDDQGYGNYFNALSMYKHGSEPMIGNGPYRRVRWLPNEECLIERYPDYWASKCDPPLPYWNPQQPYLDRIRYVIIGSTNAARTEMLKGNVSVDFDIEPQVWVTDEVKSPEFTRKVVRATNVTPSYTYVGWNMKNPLFTDKRVRQALTMLIDRDKILNNVHYGLGRPQPSLLFIDGPVHDPALEPWPYDPERAGKLLREAGWLDRDGDGVLDSRSLKDENGNPLRFTFSYLIHNARDYHARIADIMKEELGKHGVDLKIEQIEWTLFSDRVKQQRFDAVRFAWATDFYDPDEYQIYHSSQSKNQGDNFVNFKNERADQILEEVRLTLDYPKRIELNRELERIVWEECPYTFMFVFEELYFYSPKFRNVKFYTMRPGYDLTEWYVDPEWKFPE